MPLDSTTYTETTTEPTLDDLIAWLETRDPNETYDYTNPRDCLLIRAGWSWQSAMANEGTWPYVVAAGPLSRNDRSAWTMGAALSRARAWRADHAV